MNDKYLISIWKKHEETDAHQCIEEIYKNQGFWVKNYHKDDRVNENGVDILCKKGNVKIGISVKKKPNKSDVKQFHRFIKKNPKIKKIYVYLNSPTASFETEMKKYKNLTYWDWSILHKELIKNASKRYLILYFSVHPLFINQYQIFKTLFNNHTVKFPQHEITNEEIKFLWNVKDDSVKLKATLNYVKNKWNSELMNKTNFNQDEYLEIIEKIHSELEIINSTAGRVFFSSFKKMEREYPYLLAKYWELVSERTKWKEFTATSVKLSKFSEKAVEKYILYSWVLPDLNEGQYSYIMKGFYSTLNYLIENAFEMAKDLEDGIDWLFSDIIESKDSNNTLST